MQLAVEASSEHQKCHTVQMEIVAAAWAFAECDQECACEQHDNPDEKHGSHRSVGRGDGMGTNDGRKIGEHCSKKQFAAASGLLHNRSIG